MQILLIAATLQEIKPITTAKPKMDVLITGVGVPATLYHLQKKLQQKRYDFVIQAGIAGTFTDELTLGETVLIKQDTFADIGAEEKRTYTSFMQSGLINADEFPYKKGWLINEYEIKSKTFKWVNAVTINKVSDSFLQKMQLIQAFKPKVESMEGAALHYVCLQEKIPFVQVRSISNFVGERDKAKWEINKAIKNLNTALPKLINQITT